MRQVLHIFAKDVRRFWPEIVLSLASIAAVALVYPHLWSGPIPTRSEALKNHFFIRLIFSRSLCVLVVVTWCLLITRAFHAEALVGDRQFWLTRPYERKKLLAAKLMFVLVFVYLPLAVAQAVLQVAAGLNPLAAIPGMAFDLLLITGIFVVPFMAIAVVTSSFVGTIMSVVAVAIGSVIVGAMQLPPFANIIRFRLPWGSQLPIALLFLCVCGTVVVLQYAWRNAVFSRLVLLAIPAVLGAIAIFAPNQAFSDPARIAREFRPSGASDVPHLLLKPTERRPLRVLKQHSAREGDWFSLLVPLEVSPVPANTAINADRLTVTLTAADGAQWMTAAPFVYPERILPDYTARYVEFTIPVSVYEKFKSKPLTLDVSLALTELKVTRVTRMHMPTQEVSVPGVGVCKPNMMGFGFLLCRSAYRAPELTYVSAEWSSTPCAAPQTAMQEVRGPDWAGYIDSEPAEFGISPIVFSGFAFMSDWNNTTGGKYLCTDTPVTFTQFKAVRRTQTSLTLRDFVLPAQS